MKPFTEREQMIIDVYKNLFEEKNEEISRLRILNDINQFYSAKYSESYFINI